MDFRICQTSTVSPAEPGDFPLLVKEPLQDESHCQYLDFHHQNPTWLYSVVEAYHSSSRHLGYLGMSHL